MSTHYHLLIETPDANQSKGMRQLNGVYTQASNRQRGWVGRESVWANLNRQVFLGDDHFVAQIQGKIVRQIPKREN